VTKPLAISQRQVQSLIRAAAAERAIVEVKIGDTVVRLIPEGNPQGSPTVDEKEKGYF
jgi:hypothetical protein